MTCECGRIASPFDNSLPLTIRVAILWHEYATRTFIFSEGRFSMSMSPWLDSLNERQSEAVTHRASPLLVLAGPGSGKTRILTHRIAWLIREKGARPEQILAVAFTNRAAEEMRDRLAALLGDEAGRVWIYTFHATAVRILRRFGAAIGIDPAFGILDEDEQRHALNRILSQLDLSRELFPSGQILSYLSRRKNALIDPAEPSNEGDATFAEIARAYESWLRERNVLDFDDLIRYAVELLRQNEDIRQHYRRTLFHVLVDEYQDINDAQYELLKLLAPPGSSVTIVADDDQSIYGWRGSKPELIDEFIDRYHPQIVKLDISYRCPPNILYGAQRLIAHQRSQERQRFMHSEHEGESLIYHYIFNDLQQEQRWLVTLVRKLIDERGHKPGDIAILYRTHQLGDPVEQTLMQADFRVQRLVKESFFDLPATREIVRFLQIMRALTEENFTAAVNFPLRQIDELTMIQLRRLAEERGVDLVDLARRPYDYPEISPLTRAHLHHFLQWVDALPTPDVDAAVAVRSLFQLLEQLRSPWRVHDLSLVEGLIAFTDYAVEAQTLAEAIVEDRPIVVIHPATIDGYTAAAVLHHALITYLDVDVQAIAGNDVQVADLAANAIIMTVGEDLPTLPQTVIRLGTSHGPHALTVDAWRLAQSLLAGYETLNEGPFVVYDIETTGTHIRRDEIVEIAAARYQGQSLDGGVFHSFVRPEREYIPAAATQVHNIRFEDVAEAPPIADVLPRFLDYVGQDTVVGHNIARFDNRFIDRACGLTLDQKGFNPHYVDTLRLARRLLPGDERHSLESVRRSLGLNGSVSHRAEGDVAQTADVFFALTRRLLADKEREALAETLPLVALASLSANIQPFDENQVVLDGAARMLAAGRGQPLLDDLLAALPAHLQAEANEQALRLATHEAPVTEEDAAWTDLQQAFSAHLEAFQRYSSDKSLGAFMDYQALLTSLDTFAHTADEDRITLMTLHNAKGSEFPVVIIVGVEQEHLPLWRTLNDPEQLAEERRVFYVGLTRAQEAVYLFSVRDRGDGFMRNPSRFAFEIPVAYIRHFNIDAQNRMRELK